MMAIIRNTFSPFIQPQEAKLIPAQLRNIQNQPDAFQQMFQPQSVDVQQLNLSNQLSSIANQSPTSTADRFQQQYETATDNARALPTPTPVANNSIAATQTNPITNFMVNSKVRPDFQQFYNQLTSITQIGEDATAAEILKAQARRQELFNQLNSINVGNNSVPVKLNSNAISSSGPNPVKTDRVSNQRLGKELAAQVGWTGSQWNAFNQLVMKESGWNNNAQNPTSTAFGIGQFLNSTWGSYGIPKTSDPKQQITAMIRYIKARYGNPQNALNFHLQHNWY